MNNLSFYDYKHVTYKTDIKNQCSCTNASSSIYIASRGEGAKTIQIHKINGDGDRSAIHLTSTSLILSELIYLETYKKLWLLLQDELILIDLSLEQIERVDLPETILSAKWNTKQDVLCAYFKSEKIACYSIDFEFNELITLHEGECSVRITLPDELNTNEIKTFDQLVNCNSTIKTEKIDFDVAIDWSFNSELFAINCFTGAKRCINLFNNKCQLYRKVEYDCMLPFVAFQPITSNMLAFARHELSHQILTLIDCKGILKSKLLLQDGIAVKDIKWSPDGDYLAVYQKFNEDYFIDLILAANCEIKKRICIKRINPLITFDFVKVESKILCIKLFLKNGSYKYTYVKNILKCDWIRDYGIVCNIDGRKLTTKFYSADEDEVVINEIIEEDIINAVIFNETFDLLAVVNASDLVNIYDYQDLQNWKKSKSFQLENISLDSPIGHYRFYFKKRDLVGIGIQHKYDIQIIYSEGKATRATCDKHIIYAHYLMKFKRDYLISSRNHRVPLMNLITINFKSYLFTISLNINGGLVINDIKIEGHFTSMHCHYRYLLVTVKNKKNEGLYCFKISKELLFKELISLGLQKKICFYKDIEPGSIIWYSIAKSKLAVVLLPNGKSGSIELKNFSLADIYIPPPITETYEKLGRRQRRCLNEQKKSNAQEGQNKSNVKKDIDERIGRQDTTVKSYSDSANTTKETQNNGRSSKKTEVQNSIQKRNTSNIDKKEQNTSNGNSNRRIDRPNENRKASNDRISRNNPSEVRNSSHKSNNISKEDLKTQINNERRETETTASKRRRDPRERSNSIQESTTKPRVSSEDPRKRFKTEPNYHIKTDLNVIILDNTTINRSMNEKDAAKLRTRILSMIDETIEKKEIPPKFKEANLLRNYFHVSCADMQSLDWLVNSIDRLNSISDKPALRVVPEDYIKRRRLSVFIPGQLEATRIILGRLQGQNPMIDTSKWDLYHSYVYQNGMVYFIEMDEESFDELYRLEWKMYVGLDQLVFRGIEESQNKSFTQDMTNGTASTSNYGYYN